MRVVACMCIGIALLLRANIAGDGRAAAMGGQSEWRYKNFVHGLESVGPPSWSPDGRALAFVAYPDYQVAVATVNLSEQTVRVVCRGAAPRWSPGGDLIAFLNDEPQPGYSLHVVPWEGGEPRKLVDDLECTEIAWSPDGRYLAFQRIEEWESKSGPTAHRTVSSGDVYAVEVASGAVRRVTRFAEALPSDAYELSADVLAWTARGEIVILVKVATVAWAEPSSLAGLYAVNFRTNEVRKLFGGEFDAALPSPDAQESILSYRSPRDAAARWSSLGEPRAGIMLGRAEEQSIRGVAGTSYGEALSIASVSWPRRVLVAEGRGSDMHSHVLTTIELDSGRRQVLTPAGVLDGAPGVSPDGSKVAFYRKEQLGPGSGGPHGELYVVGIDGGNARPAIDAVEAGSGEPMNKRTARTPWPGAPVAEEPEATPDVTVESSGALLHEAATLGHLQRIRDLLWHGANVNAQDRFGDTPLHAAAIQGRTATAELLIEMGADVNAVGGYGETPLHMAAFAGRAKVSEVLMRRGADVNAADRYGKTPLHEAVTEGHLAVVGLLLEGGADVNAQDEGDQTPLGLAATLGHFAIVRLLVERGADVNARDQLGETPLHPAVRGDHADIARFLVERGADVNAKGERHTTPLHLASLGGDAAVVQLLIERGADVNAASRYGAAPLHLAARAGRTAIAQLLIESGADVNAKGRYTEPPLRLALTSGQTATARLLIESGADVNAADKHGEAPLHLAALGGDSAIVQLLIERGAHVNARSDVGGTPLAIALGYDDQAIAELLRQHGGAE